MQREKVYTAIGLMSGTSLDGVDAALLETDGLDYVRVLGFVTKPYPSELRARLRACFGRESLDAAGKLAERDMTLFHAQCVQDLLAANPDLASAQSLANADQPLIIGFHGQTILHDIEHKITVQIGDAALLAAETGLDVVYDFRSRDVAAGGQGAPLVPLYHRALIRAAGQGAAGSSGSPNSPIALLNIGGVGNITWIGADDLQESASAPNLIAFDTGTGNALMDDFARRHFGVDYDHGGVIAARGQPDEEILSRWMGHPYFTRKPPKSLDRNEWDIAALGPLADDLNALSPEDAMASLLAFSVRGVVRAFEYLPAIPEHIYLCGGGRHNTALAEALARALPCPVGTLDDLGWNGDATEAECFAYLAVRSLKGLPISLPETTGVAAPLTGGVLVRA
ncbi:MAG: anhydro-N-acetylmuramic acid kinase [Alphaproteobacteria bacterium]